MFQKDMAFLINLVSNQNWKDDLLFNPLGHDLDLAPTSHFLYNGGLHAEMKLNRRKGLLLNYALFGLKGYGFQPLKRLQTCKKAQPLNIINF